MMASRATAAAAGTRDDCWMNDNDVVSLEEDDDFDSNDMQDVLMASINLEDSAGFPDFGDVHLVEDGDHHHHLGMDVFDNSSYRSKQDIGIGDSLLFDPSLQQFEWREEVSLLKQMRVNRLSTLFEE